MNVSEEYGNQVIMGIRGLIREDEYEKQLEEKASFLKNGTLGRRSDYFTYWSSSVLTNAVALLALSKLVYLQR